MLHGHLSRPRWLDPPAVPVDLPPLHPDPLLHALLAVRVGSPEQAISFLDPRPRRIPEPGLVPNMAEATARITRAIERREQIGIFGDYDADGLTSSAILALALRRASQADLIAIELPTRETGYGLHPDAIERFAATGVTLLIAVDCGTNERDNVELARRLGIDVIAIDHHELTGEPDDGLLLVSPRVQPDAPYRDLPAAGLALLTVTALARRGFDVGDGPGADPESLLDLAMVGTIADVSDLRGENRAIVRDGLRVLRDRPRPGLLALLTELNIDPKTATARTISHRVAPALNAPGRRGDPLPGLELLLAADAPAAGRLVKQLLDDLQWVRSERNRLEERAHAVLAADAALAGRRIAILDLGECPPGLAGVVAGGVAEELGRPTIILGRDGDRYHGSARSRGDFDIGGAIQSVAGLLERAGGHRKAAGLALLAANLLAFRDAIEQTAIDHGLDLQTEPALQIDAELPADRLNLATLDAVAVLRPHGAGNPEPVFRITAAPIHDYSTMGNAQQHLKIRVKTPRGLAPVILWGEGRRSRELVGVRSVDLVGTLDRNDWNGRSTVQFVARDFRTGSEG